MTRVSFYVHVADRMGLLHVLLSRKILPRGMGAYIAAEDSREAGRLDDYLWTADPGDFIPHARAEDEAAADSPVVVGVGGPDSGCSAEVLVWWRESPPSGFGRFSDLIEVAGISPPEVRSARARFRHYREHGYPINVHEMGAGGGKK